MIAVFSLVGSTDYWVFWVDDTDEIEPDLNDMSIRKTWNSVLSEHLF